MQQSSQSHDSEGNTCQWYHQGILWAYPPSQRFSSFRWSSLSLTHHLIWPEPPDSSSDVYQLCHFRSNLSQCVGMWRHAISWRILILLFTILVTCWHSVIVQVDSDQVCYIWVFKILLIFLKFQYTHRSFSWQNIPLVTAMGCKYY